MKKPLATGALVALALVAGCATETDDTVTILAAASLADVMPQLVALAEQDHPETTFDISYAGSSQIVRSLNAGAEADVVILAGEGPLASLDSDLEISDPTIVATNALTIALAPGNPADLHSLDDLAGQDPSLVLCAEQVPCGEAAARMFAQVGIAPTVASYEPDVRSTLGKVTSGEADAGVVYVTDIEDRDPKDGDIGTVAVPEDAQVLNRYPALQVADSDAGADFVALLLSPDGQGVLGEAGFGTP